jgi:hypothetical protein
MNKTLQEQLQLVADELELAPSPTPIPAPQTAENSAQTAPAASVGQTTEEPAAAETEVSASMPETVPRQTASAASSETVQVKHTGPLPEISALPTLTEEDVRKMKEEAKGKSQWAQAAAAKVLELSQALHLLEEQAKADPDIVLSDEYLEKRTRIEEALGRLQDAGGSEELRKRLEFSKLLEEVRRVDAKDPSAVHDAIGKVLASGRRRKASAEEAGVFDKNRSWPAGTIFLGREAYLRRDLKPGEEYSSADKALEATLRHLIDAFKKNRRSEVEGKISSMKERGSADGQLRNPRAILDGEAGVYYLYSPKRIEGDRQYFEGHALLEVRDNNRDSKREPFYVVHVLESLGSLSWMSDPRNGQRVSLPLFWLQRGSVITSKDKRLSPEDFKRAVGLMRTILALISLNAPKPEAEVIPQATSEPVKASESAQAETTVVEPTSAEVSVAPLLAEQPKTASAPKPKKGKGRERKR